MDNKARNFAVLLISMASFFDTDQAVLVNGNSDRGSTVKSMLSQIKQEELGVDPELIVVGDGADIFSDPDLTLNSSEVILEANSAECTPATCEPCTGTCPPEPTPCSCDNVCACPTLCDIHICDTETGSGEIIDTTTDVTEITSTVTTTIPDSLTNSVSACNTCGLSVSSNKECGCGCVEKTFKINGCIKVTEEIDRNVCNGERTCTDGRFHKTTESLETIEGTTDEPYVPGTDGLYCYCDPGVLTLADQNDNGAPYCDWHAGFGKRQAFEHCYDPTPAEWEWNGETPPGDPTDPQTDKCGCGVDGGKENLGWTERIEQFFNDGVSLAYRYCDYNTDGTKLKNTQPGILDPQNNSWENSCDVIVTNAADRAAAVANGCTCAVDPTVVLRISNITGTIGQYYCEALADGHFRDSPPPGTGAELESICWVGP